MKVGVWCVLVVCSCATVSADSIRIGDTSYDNVYVSKSTAGYYVSLPDQGTVLNVNASDVDQKSVVILQDQTARQALYDKWLQESQKRKSQSRANEPVSVPEPVPSQAARSSGDDGLIKMPSSSSIKASGRAVVNDPAAEAQRLYFRQQAAAVDQERRRKEAEKLQQLNSRQVITSGTAGNRGVTTGRVGR